MKITELLRLVWLNINQNKFKSIMTSIGIVVGAATIVMVIAIGRGGQMDVAEQFSNLNAGAIDISYEWTDDSRSGTGNSMGGFGSFFGNMGNMFGGGKSGRNSEGGTSSESFGGFSGGMPGENSGEASARSFAGLNGERPERSNEAMPEGSNEAMPEGSNEAMPEGSNEMMPEGANGAVSGGFPDDVSQDPDGRSEEKTVETEAVQDADAEEETETSEADARMNQEQIILTEEDADDIAAYVPGISGVTISYSTRAAVEGGELTESQTYTVAGVKASYADISKLSMAAGSFVTDEDDAAKRRVCALGASAAKELFGSAEEAYDSILYIDDRAYTVNGVLASSGMVSAGITPDDAIFVPYETGIKYITGENISPTITVISEDVNAIDEVTANVEIVLSENYSNAEFTFADAGSKMEAAESSNKILEVLLTAMAVIVFLVGGIGIMNVLFVSVKERTNEIGILKSLGASRSNILFEFLIEAAAISLLGGMLGVALSFAITPVVEYYGVRVETSMTAWVSALGFAVLTGTLFGIYPAWKASRLVPVEALNAE